MSNKTAAIFKIFVTIAVLWFLLMIYLAIFNGDLCSKRENDQHKVFYVRTSGCEIRNLDLMAKELEKFGLLPDDKFRATETEALIEGREEREKEKGCRPPPLTRIESSWLVRNIGGKVIKRYYPITGDWRLAKCSFTEIKAMRNEKNVYGKSHDFDLTEITVLLPPDYQFIEVKCFDAEGHLFYENLHFVIEAMDRLNKQNGSILDPPVLSCPHNIAKQSRNEKMSVLVFGIDNVTHYDFPKIFPETNVFLKSLPHSVEYWGYNKVAGSATGNMLPVLKGISECRHKTHTMSPDLSGYLWQAFRDAGFGTLYVENDNRNGLLYKTDADFIANSSDFDFRPYHAELRKEQTSSYNSNENATQYDVSCNSSGRQQRDHVVFEVMRQMIPLYKQNPMFSMYWLSTESREFTRFDDAELFRTLEQLYIEGVFDRTFIIITSNPPDSLNSDVLQRQKDRLPLLMMIYPKFMEKEYVSSIYNLHRNAHRLTTPFDLHATLSDLTNLDNLEDSVLKFEWHNLIRRVEIGYHIPMGNSLFMQSFCSRSCLDAGIPKSFCACHDYGKVRKSKLRYKSRHVKSLVLF